MIESEQPYDYYAEKLANIMEQNKLLDPFEKNAFVRYVRGY